MRTSHRHRGPGNSSPYSEIASIAVRTTPPESLQFVTYRRSVVPGRQPYCAEFPASRNVVAMKIPAALRLSCSPCHRVGRLGRSTGPAPRSPADRRGRGESEPSARRNRLCDDMGGDRSCPRIGRAAMMGIGSGSRRSWCPPVTLRWCSGRRYRSFARSSGRTHRTVDRTALGHRTDRRRRENLVRGRYRPVARAEVSPATRAARLPESRGQVSDGRWQIGAGSIAPRVGPPVDRRLALVRCSAGWPV